MGQSVSNLASASSNTSRESGFQSPPIRNPELDRAPSNPDRPADERTLVIEENLPHLDLKEVLEPVLKQEDLKEADEVLEGEKENGPSNWEEGMGGGSEWNGWGDNTNPQVPWIVTDDNGNENETVIEDRGWRNGGAFTESHHNRSFKTRANRFGSNCKYNRPVRRKNKAVMEKVKGKEESMAVPGQTECKVLITPIMGSKCRVRMGLSGLIHIADSNNTGWESGWDCALSDPYRPADEHTLVIQERLQHLDFKEVLEPVLKQEDEKTGNWDLKEADEVLEGEKENGPSNWEEEMGGGSECNGWDDNTSLQVPWIVTDDNGDENVTVIEDWGERNGGAFTESHQYRSLKTGASRFGSNCKFNRPSRRKNKAVKVKQKVESMAMPGQTECKVLITHIMVVKEKVKEPGKSTERPGQTECKSYFTSGVCKYGRACRYKHTRSKASGTEVLEPNSPDLPMRPTIVIGWFNLIDLKVVEEKVKERGKSTERPGQTECKSYLTSGVCKYGRACKHKHTKGKASGTAVLELNFLDLPIRPGAKECPYYMSTGSCKYGTNCRFNHPDPLAVDQEDDGGSAASGASQSSMQSSSPPRTLNVTAPYVPMELSPSPGFPPQNPHGYQAPVYIPEMSMHPTLAEANVYTYYEDPTLAEANVYTYYEDQVQVDEYPERPGQPECSRFIKTGDCKFKLNCRYHHPKDRIVKSPPCALSDTGLPLRPDHNICEQYSRYGICKFGQACKFDHPVHPVSGWEW
ncbi:uncharacterized protein LOC122280884 isoform X19 [Carya illinoinensis]|uniref:uncharacterized protein LOC122280884 isoform X19 n=1 Tax=Carya illinoinensis TaxID=32201 RepID=UPI001C71D14C|nr:uncharacterized protein LOC122280884 isoform X19 [Carya illinoinensis]